MDEHEHGAPRSGRLTAKATTFMAGLRVDALTAPGIIDGPMNGDTFIAYVGQVLAPTLQSGDVVIMGSLRPCSGRLLSQDNI